MKRIITLALLLAGTAAIGQTAAPRGPSGVDKAAIDPAVKPGDDFNLYANGGWLKTAEIPADRASTGIFFDVFQVAEARNAEIIKGAAAANAAPGSDQRRIADYYAAYMDTAGNETRGLTPLKPELAAIAAIKDKAALATFMGRDLRADEDALNTASYGSPNLFGLWITQALEAPTVTVPYVMQGGLGLPDRDYYLSTTADMVQVRAAYKAYVAKVFSLAGYSDPDARAQRVFDLETKIARAHLDRTASEDAIKGNNPWKRGDFATKAPGLDWNAYFTAAGIAGQQDFIAWQPGAITGESALVASEPLASWQDWLAFHHIARRTASLPKAFDDANFDFYGRTLSGTQAQRPRDKRGIAAVNGQLGDAVGKIYAQRYFPASSKADIQAMVKNILAAFDTRVAHLTWMAPATKAEARRKIETMRVGIGYPESWRDYSALVIRADDPIGNAERAEIAEYHHQLAKIGKPVDKGEWWMTPQTVNAVNLPLQNALNFPAAILEAPFYQPKADAAANYGSIGAVIGHEISHSFDNTGAEFDASGKLRNWWTPDDFAHFKAQGAALVAQYNAYEPVPGVHINGEQTLGENIADVAGLTAAYEAYHASLGGKPAPVIDGLTGDQRFFLAFAQSWQEKTREKALRAQLATDGHSPGGERAQTVRNLDGWYAAFGIKPGDKLYLPPEKRVHVW
jgi:putative endopeptidase